MQLGAALRCPHCGETHPREAKACPMTGRPMPGSLVPEQVLDGKYRILRHLADGGMGSIYEAEHLLIGKRVAVKTLHPDLAKNDELTARFHQEARAASAIGHEHIVDMSDMGRCPDGSLFMVMELLRGQNLGERLASIGGRMPLPRAAHIMRQVVEALAAAHSRGIVHRDLKPENIFLVHRGTDPDFVKVLDFGVSKVISDDPQSKMQSTGVVFGTPYYMAPEQAQGGQLDHRVDIYACGAILYQLATGQLPFTANNFNALMFAIASGRYVPPRALAPEIPPEFEQIIGYAMALNPNNRYQSGDHLAQVLAPYGRAEIAQPPPPEPALPPRPMAAPIAVPQMASAPQMAPMAPSMAPMAPMAPSMAPMAAAPSAPVSGRVAALEAQAPVAPPMRRRKGSKALPITVAAGVAVGVCVGLIVIRGTGKADTGGGGGAPSAEFDAGTAAMVAAPDGAPKVVAAPKPDAAPLAAATTADAAPKVAAATPDAAPKVAVAPKPDAAPAVAVPANAEVKVTLTFTIAPPEAVKDAVILVDGKAIRGTACLVTSGPRKPVKIVVKSKGYSDFSKSQAFTADATIPVTLSKKKSGGGGTKPVIEL
jgi:eukaryotic-like serine/threonine-protein kinase